MIKFVCDNGSFEIQSSREARNYNNSKVIKLLEIMVSSQDITIDEIDAKTGDIVHKKDAPLPENFRRPEVNIDLKDNLEDDYSDDDEEDEDFDDEEPDFEELEDIENGNLEVEE